VYAVSAPAGIQARSAWAFHTLREQQQGFRAAQPIGSSASSSSLSEIGGAADRKLCYLILHSREMSKFKIKSFRSQASGLLLSWQK
jgi:hypothetical protein